MTFKEAFEKMDKQDLTMKEDNKYIKIRTIEIAGIASVLQALRLPFGLECRSTTGANYEYNSTFFAAHSMAHIEPKDMHLLSTLVKRGDAHAKTLRGLLVYVEIEAPVYWWVEAETHRYGHERLSSSSTMHMDCKGLGGDELVEAKSKISMGKMMKKIDYFSYQALRNIYKLRHDHRLPEWREFCAWIENLPFANELILVGLDDDNKRD